MSQAPGEVLTDWGILSANQPKALLFVLLSQEGVADGYRCDGYVMVDSRCKLNQPWIAVASPTESANGYNSYVA